MSTLNTTEARLEAALSFLASPGDPSLAIALARPLLVLVQIDLGVMREARNGYRDDSRAVYEPTPLERQAEPSRRVQRHVAPQVLEGALCDSEGGSHD